MKSPHRSHRSSLEHQRIVPRLLRSVRALAPWKRTLYIVSFAQLASAVGFSNIFPFLPLYVKELGTNTSLSVEFLSGAVFSAQALTMMIASPLWGFVADKYGRKLMIQRATYGGAILVFLMGFARTAEELVLLRAIQGLVAGVVSAANALVASATPRERSGFAMGMIQVALRAGVAIGPLIGGAVADAFGYRLTFVVTAVLLFSAGVIVQYGVKESFSPGLSVGQEKATFLSGWRKTLTVSGVRTTYSLRFLAGLASLLIVPIAPLFMQVLIPNSDHINTVTGLMTALASAATTVTAIYFGRLGDRIGHRRILRTSAILAGIFYLPQAFVGEAWQLLMLQALTGAAAGGIITCLSALLAGYAHPGAEGSVFGLDSSVFAASRAVAPLFGAAVASWYGFRSAFFIAGLLYLAIAAIAVWRLPRTPHQQNRQPRD